MRVLNSVLLWLFVLLGAVSALSNEKLHKQANKDGGIIRLTNKNFKRILSGPRNSYIMVLLTATNPQVNCVLCNEFTPEYQNLVVSWIREHPDGLSTEIEDQGLFFAKADFIDPNTNDVFGYYKVNNVPKIFLFKPNGNIDTYDDIGVPSKAGPQRVQALINMLKDQTGFHNFNYYEPFNWGSFVATVAFTSITTILVKKNKNFVFKVLSYRPVWGVVFVTLIIALTTGAMFNRIRDTPYVGVSPDGTQAEYIAVSQQQFQFAVESQIMSFIYGALAIAVLLLTLFTPKLSEYYRKNNKSAHAPIYLVSSLGFASFIYIAFAVLIAVFKLKNSSYPFKLLSLPFI
ncbi:HEL279Wp [Eremothecium sinecaudum]|uniref:HEL279Wp n=1 Tax=Eremothecium sinecaudum TaxID=45286 RepID=A0A120K2B6_9SACH|nr:HEL279Wp [Eremothecium sinecaudum]AMD21002.1 HEL279Wp [Eremothecium sinecaudum]